MLSRLFTCPALPRLAHLLQSDRLPTRRECWGGAVHAGGCGPPTDCSACCFLFCGSNACQSCCDACTGLRAVLVPARCDRTCSLACCCCALRLPACLCIRLCTRLPALAHRAALCWPLLVLLPAQRDVPVLQPALLPPQGGQGVQAGGAGRGAGGRPPRVHALQNQVRGGGVGEGLSRGATPAAAPSLAFEHLRPVLPVCCLVSGKGTARRPLSCTCPRSDPHPPTTPTLPHRFKENKEGAVLCSQQLDREELDQFRAAVAEDYYFQVCVWGGGWGVGGVGGGGKHGCAPRHAEAAGKEGCCWGWPAQVFALTGA